MVCLNVWINTAKNSIIKLSFTWNQKWLRPSNQSQNKKSCMKDVLKRKKSLLIIFLRFSLRYRKVRWTKDFQKKDVRGEKTPNQKWISKI